MSFEASGKLKHKPQKPLGFPSQDLHHMIPWATLRAFWNQLVTRKHHAQMVQYLEIVGFGGHAHHTASEVLAGRVHDIRDSNIGLYQALAEVLCWQPYNLFEGPAGNLRPGHSPDPETTKVHFASLGETPFDFPIVAPPNGARANTLHRAYGEMLEYNASGAMFPLGQCLGLLGSVAGEEIIPAHDVNWFALRRDRFLEMSSMQRLEFHRACLRHGRAADPEHEYELLFGKG